MEGKLKEILENYSDDLARRESEIENIEARIKFCSEHNLQEELRIAHVKYHATSPAVRGWGEMFKEIQELLDSWDS